ncbi:MAG: lasso peptide biosynthesis B2 protein [Desulfosporosinus sp.]|nr:lasso peptide biosynthesis B2 protein [Desulfosporosinus sp.]
MRYIRQFLSLRFTDQRPLIEAFILLGISRFLILAIKFKTVAPVLGKHGKESANKVTAQDLEISKKVAWAVRVMSKHTVWESKCLVQAMTAKIMLNRRKISSTIYLGVAKDEAQQLIAHAWLRCGDKILTGGGGRDKFTVVGIFGD